MAYYMGEDVQGRTATVTTFAMPVFQPQQETPSPRSAQQMVAMNAGLYESMKAAGRSPQEMLAAGVSVETLRANGIRVEYAEPIESRTAAVNAPAPVHIEAAPKQASPVVVSTPVVIGLAPMPAPTPLPEAAPPTPAPTVQPPAADDTLPTSDQIPVESNSILPLVLAGVAAYFILS